MKTAISEAKVLAMLTREKALFIQRNPKSKGHSDNAARNWLRGVPMHWMVDWGTPFPLFIEKAQGVDLTDADGNTYIDFCLGDTGAMFGHSPKPVVDTLLREGGPWLHHHAALRQRREGRHGCWKTVSNCRPGRSPQPPPTPTARCCAGAAP